MRVSEGNYDSIVDASNSCYAEYHHFVGLSVFELNGLQSDYYSELHTLQEELNGLINELREDLLRYNKGFLSQTA
jgi:hypothetical protein